MMIRANELRIWALVRNHEGHGSQILQVKGLLLPNILTENVTLNNHPEEYFLKDLFGIDITEEWLLKFGFKQLSDNENWRNFQIDETFAISQALVDYIGKRSTYRKGHFYYAASDIEIETVHHLQNLYWCMRGKELTLNNEAHTSYSKDILS